VVPQGRGGQVADESEIRKGIVFNLNSARGRVQEAMDEAKRWSDLLDEFDRAFPAAKSADSLPTNMKVVIIDVSSPQQAVQAYLQSIEPGQEFTRNDISKFIRKEHGAPDHDKSSINYALNRLVAAGEIEVVRPGSHKLIAIYRKR
jgi:hypothetical protein